MILVDSSVWIDHLRSDNRQLSEFLEQQLVEMHPFVFGELACGYLSERSRTLALLDNLPVSKVATDTEVRFMIEHLKIFGTGLGWVDMHLLASVRITAGSRLWTFDNRLASMARHFVPNGK